MLRVARLMLTGSWVPREAPASGLLRSRRLPASDAPSAPTDMERFRRSTGPYLTR